MSGWNKMKFYCGYDSDTMVNNVFAYGPDGKVFFAAVNFPGSWADRALTAWIFGIHQVTDWFIKNLCGSRFSTQQRCLWNFGRAGD
jgi:hypothetical protein